MVLLQVHEVTDTSLYGGIFLAVLGWFGLFLLQWGAMREFKRYVTQELGELKKTVAERILPRQEYENRHHDLTNRVERLEQNEFLKGRSIGGQ